MNISGRLAGAVFAFATLLAACGSDSGSSVDAPRTIDSPPVVVDAPPVVVDAPPVTDGGFSGACTTASCFVLDPGPTPGDLITTHPTTEDAPTLTGIGSNSLNGDYTLTMVDVYTKGTFSPLVSTATVSDNGNSNGTGRFADDLWGYYLNFDLHFAASALGQSFDGDATQTLRGGGCFTLAGAALTTETGRCDVGWPQDVTPPSDYQVQYDGTTAKLKITLPKEFILALVPADSQTLASAAITGPIVFVLTFQHAVQ